MKTYKSGEKIKVKISNKVNKENLPSWLTKGKVYDAIIYPFVNYKNPVSLTPNSKWWIRLDADDGPNFGTTLTSCMWLGSGNWVIVG